MIKNSTTNSFLTDARKDELERSAWNTLVEQWKHEGSPQNLTNRELMKLFSPEKIAARLNYVCEEYDDLGDQRFNKNNFVTAGLVDPQGKKIAISLQFPKEQRRFTLAHEIAHIVEHPNQGLHRDRPINFENNTYLDITEKEANYFAGSLLMPRRIFIDEFKARFLSLNFEFTTDTISSLNENVSAFPLVACRDVHYKREKCLASSGTYNMATFESLEKCFGLSNMAVAKRIRDIDLIKYL